MSRRHRSFRRLLLGVASLVGVALIVTGVVVSPLLTLTEIQVKGRLAVPAKVIVGAVSDQLGTPLALIDYDAIRDRLSAVTRVQSFSTEVLPPHTLVVRIVEREAIGYLPSTGGWNIVDVAGIVLNTVVAQPTHYPELRVSSTTDLAFTAIADTLAALPPTIRRQIAVVDAATRDSVELTFRSPAHRVRWGSADNSEAKVAVLESALAVAARSGGVYDIDVSAPDNIVLRPR